MSKDLLHTTDTQTHTPSALTRLDLAFEYNVTWADEKKQVKNRTS